MSITSGGVVLSRPKIQPLIMLITESWLYIRRPQIQPLIITITGGAVSLC